MKVLSKRQEIMRGMAEDKIWLQCRATEKYHDQIFEEMKELEEGKSEEAPLLVQKKYDLWRYQNERDEARRLQRSGTLRRTRKEADTQDRLSFESIRSSAVDQVEEMSLESPRKIQDVQVVMGVCRECNERKSRRCMEAGTRGGNGDTRNQGRFGRGGRGLRGP